MEVVKYLKSNSDGDIPIHKNVSHACIDENQEENVQNFDKVERTIVKEETLYNAKEIPVPENDTSEYWIKIEGTLIAEQRDDVNEPPIADDNIPTPISNINHSGSMIEEIVTSVEDNDAAKSNISGTNKSLNISLTEFISNLEIENNENVNENTSQENITMNLNPQEWLNLDEFEDMIKEIDSVNTPDIFDIEAALETHTVERSSVDTNNNKIEIQVPSEMANDDVICISSDEDTKLNSSIDNLHTISLSSSEENDGGNDLDKKMKTEVKYCNDVTNSEIILVDDKQFRDINQNLTELKSAIDTNNTQTAEENKGIDKAEFQLCLPVDNDFSITEALDESEMDKISLVSKSSFCSGYHSSDFEFISEEEARRDGLIVNYFKKTAETNENGTCGTVEVTPDSEINCSQNSYSLDINPPGSSRPNVPPWNHTGSPNFVVDGDYRRHHNIPHGERYLSLFDGNYAPTTPYMFENKSMHNTVIQNQYEGIGFDMRLMPRRPGECENDEQLKKEASESAKIMVNMYPEQNKKRMRRF